MRAMLPFAALILASSAWAAANLLHNPSFEGPFAKSGCPQGWDYYGSRQDVKLAAAELARSGRASLLISDHNPSEEVGVSQTVPKPPARQFFAASVWARSMPGGRGAGGYLQLRFLPSDKLYQAPLKAGADSWQRTIVAGRAPDGTTHIRIYIYTHRETICDVLVDDAELVALESEADLLKLGAPVDLRVFPPPPIERLKPLHIETLLAEGGQPRCIIAAPDDGSGDEAARAIASAIRRASGAKVSVLPAARVPIPPQSNVIALGNRATNDFLRRMYDAYYCYVDQKYPGPGGWLVRSVHNPWGNGHNIIIVGASDPEGLAPAADHLISLIRRNAAAGRLVLGWIMQIHLSPSYKVPTDADDVRSWEDSVAYPPATYFGWNSLSRRLALYYMTGDERFLRQFMWLAFPDEAAIKHMWKVDGERVEDKRHPLRGPYHYCAHQLILLWDLVEESPFFSDEDRLKITREFAHQLEHWQAEWCYPGRNYGRTDVLIGSRHHQYAALSLYCLARYFCKYYPHPVWQRNLEAAQAAFSSIARTFFLGGEGDHLWWYSTGLEPLMSYMILSGDRRGLESGHLQTLLRGFDLLQDGTPKGRHLRCMSISFAHKAAYLTGDGRFLFWRDLTGMDLNGFRIGQSFWPTVKHRKPTELIGRAWVRPLAPEAWAARRLKIPRDQAFQFASYRTGLTDRDDYILFDGYYGGSRNPYHCMAIYQLRVGSVPVLDGYLNQLVARLGGLCEPHIPVAAALEVAAGFSKAAAFRAAVPDASYGTWRRWLLHLAGRGAVIIDEFTPRRDAQQLQIDVHFDMPSRPVAIPGGIEMRRNEGTVRVIAAQPAEVSINRDIATFTHRLAARSGQSVLLAFACGPAPEERQVLASRDGALVAARLAGQPVLVSLGKSQQLSAEGKESAALAAPGLLACFSASGATLGGRRAISASAPVSLQWDISAGTVQIECSADCTLALAAAGSPAVDGKRARARRRGDMLELRLPAGRHTISGLQPAPWLQDAVRTALARAEHICSAVPRQAPPQPQPAVANVRQLQPTQLASLPGPVRFLLEVDGGFAAISRDGHVLISAGGEKRQFKLPAEPLSAAYWPSQRLLLAGCRDDFLYAYNLDGSLRWKFQSVMHEDVYKTGKTYWFKSAIPGVRGLLVGELKPGVEWAFAGSACTIEVVDANGKLVKRLPQYWGAVAVMAIVELPDGSRRLLAAKTPNGFNNVGIVNPDGWRIDYGFVALPPGVDNIPAWSAQNIQRIIPADLDGDGKQEVVMDTNGSWNFVRAYTADGRPLWAASFGPSLRYGQNRYMRGLAVADLDGDGRMEVAAAAQSRHVVAFDAAGKRLWSYELPSVPVDLAAVQTGRGAVLAAGCEDGAVFLLNAAGQIIARAAADASVQAILPVPGRLLVATAHGSVIELEMQR